MSCFFGNLFVLINICVAPWFCAARPSYSLQPAHCSTLRQCQLLCSDTVTNSLSSPKNSTPLPSSKSILFPQNTRGGISRKEMDRLLAFHSYPQYTFGFKVSWEPFDYASPYDGPTSSARRRHLLCSILSRTCTSIEGGAYVHKRCRAHLAEELSGLSSARRAWSVLYAHL